VPRALLSDLITVPVVTSLPVGPSDGMEIKLRIVPTVVPADTTPILWHLCWDAANAAWLPVGRQEPVYAHRGLVEFTSFSANAWGNVSVNDPTVTVPRAGDYDAEWGCGTALVNGVSSAYMGLQIAGVDPGPGNSGADTPTVSYAQTNATWDKSAPGHRKLTGLAAGATVKHRYYTGVAGNVYRGNAYLKLYPRRITG